MCHSFEKSLALSPYLHSCTCRNFFVIQPVLRNRCIFVFSTQFQLTKTMEDQGGSSAPRVSDKRLAQTQAKVDEVVGIMRVNVEKVLERDQKLSELDNRADALQHGAAQFEQQAGKLKRKYWWQNLKMMLIIGAIGAVLLIIIIVWATSGSGGGTAAPVTQAPPADAGR